jgi:hypothetical protein
MQSGTFSLATTGDQILVYTGSPTSPLFIFALSTVPWVPAGTTVTSQTSVLPAGLTWNGTNSSIEFPEVMNGAYIGDTYGTKYHILTDLSQVLDWSYSVDGQTTYEVDGLNNFVVVVPTMSPTEQPTHVPTKSADSSSDSTKSDVKIVGLSEDHFTIVIAIVVGIVMLVTGLICIHRYRLNRDKSNETNPLRGRDPQVSSDVNRVSLTRDRKQSLDIDADFSND